MNNQPIQNSLIDIAVALSSETNINRLLEMIVEIAKAITHADGGTLYKIHDGNITMELVYSTSLGLKLGGLSPLPADLPRIPLYWQDGSPNLKNVVSYCFHNNKTINIEDAYSNQLFDFSGTKQFDQQNGYHSQAFLAVPMKNHENDIIGILQLINPIDANSQAITRFSEADQQITEALASLAAIALTKQALVSNLETLFESLVELIAAAIDNKSPYTAGHCRRVPELTMMLAEAAHQTDHGYLKDFTMTEADRYELKIAGWLHDCGKITTPEYVIDKATKLETIFDRIALVETRFEVLKRDQEISLLKAKLAALAAGEKPADDLDDRYQQNLVKMAEDLAFIRTANIGGEFMTPADQARISAMQQSKWLLNNEQQPLLTDNEVYNLNIAKGTLTNEERKVINQHIDTTIAMLEKIAFPKHLKNVPEYAGGHHEKMDGSGYPRKLKRDDMSIQARVMAIADIFEALTAKDRPYKKAKTLSESLAILETMKNTQHIDPDIYDAFMEHKIYRKYAEMFLDDFQIDVD